MNLQFHAQVFFFAVVAMFVCEDCLAEQPYYLIMGTSTPTTITNVVGQTATLPCSVKRRIQTRWQGSVYILWTKENGNVLTYKERRIIDDKRFRIDRPRPKDWNLVIENLTLADAGEYICMMNTEPVQTKRLRLKILRQFPVHKSTITTPNPTTTTTTPNATTTTVDSLSTSTATTTTTKTQLQDVNHHIQTKEGVLYLQGLRPSTTKEIPIDVGKITTTTEIPIDEDKSTTPTEIPKEKSKDTTTTEIPKVESKSTTTTEIPKDEIKRTNKPGTVVVAANNRVCGNRQVCQFGCCGKHNEECCQISSHHSKVGLVSIGLGIGVGISVLIMLVFLLCRRRKPGVVYSGPVALYVHDDTAKAKQVIITALDRDVILPPTSGPSRDPHYIPPPREADGPPCYESVENNIQ